MTPYTTRIAPSPTGDMHLGTARTAYFNWLAARASGGKFILRIDDTDQARNDPASVQVILDTMAWLGLDYDLLAYQSQRLMRYNEVTTRLLNEGLASSLPNGAVVLRPTSIPSGFTDDLAGTVKINPDEYAWGGAARDGKIKEGIVLMRAPQNGVTFPTYHFATVVDDVDMGVNYVIRGIDHLTNTGKQAIIYGALKQPLPRYCHVGLIAKDGKPLSKRDGAASMLRYRDDGTDPDAMLNFMLRMGWGPSVDDATTKLIPRDRALQLFLDGGRMRSSQANMDLQKLQSFDRKYKGQKRHA